MLPMIVSEQDEIILYRRDQEIMKAAPKTQTKSAFQNPWTLGNMFNYTEPSPSNKMSFRLLKQMSASPVISAIIRTRVNQVSMFCTPIVGPVRRGSMPAGYRIKIKDKHEKKYNKADERLIQEVIDFLTAMGTSPQQFSPHQPKRDGFEKFTRKIIRDALTYDQGCAEKVRSRGNTEAAEIWPVDASTIRIATQKDEHAFVQVIGGMPGAQYMSNEMIFWVRNPRTCIETMGYGYSELEDLITTISSQLYADKYMRNSVAKGNQAEGVLNLKGDIIKEDLDSFRSQWRSVTTGVGNARRVPVLNAKEGAEFVKMGNSNKEMEYSKWIEYLIKIATAIYQIDPGEINFDISKGSSGQKPMFESSQEARMKQSKDKGLRPLLKQYETMLNEEIVSEFDPSAQLEFIGLDDSTEEEVIKLSTQEVESYKTVDEVREERGLDPLGEEKGGTLILNPQYIQAMAAKQQQEMAEQQYGAQDMFSGEEEYEYEDDTNEEDTEEPEDEPEDEDDTEPQEK